MTKIQKQCLVGAMMGRRVLAVFTLPGLLEAKAVFEASVLEV